MNGLVTFGIVLVIISIITYVIMVYLIRESASGNTDTNWTILVVSIVVFIVGIILIVIGDERNNYSVNK